MKKILISGATGFLGSYLVKEFNEKGFYVKATGRNVKKGEKIQNKNVEFIQCDIQNEDECIEKFKDIDYVIHAAALSNPWGDYDEFYRTNVVGTKNIIKVCKENNVKRLIHISSPSIYTDSRDRFDIKEEEAPKKNNYNNYIKTKLLAEKEVKKANNLGMYTVIIRPRGIFGIGDTSIVPRILELNKTTGIPLVREGEQIIDITHVKNVVSAIKLSLIKEDISGEIFNITNDSPIKFKEVINILSRGLDIKIKYKKLNLKTVYFISIILEGVYKIFKIKKEPLLTKYKACTILFSQTLDIKNAKVKLGYKPIVSIEEGIEEYAKWRKENYDK